MKYLYISLFVLFISSINAFATVNNNELKLTVTDYNNWGWESLVIENGYIELVIVPEIGGRVMRYAFPGDQQMAIHPKNIGKKFDPVSDKWGPWSGAWGYGGFKNWPAPQSFWNWPPPPHLCWGPYSYNIEHQSADSLVIYLESKVETQVAKGLQQARRFTVYKNSTLVKLEQYLINISATARELSIWDVTQTIVQHDSEKDMDNFSVYFSTSKNIRYADQKLNITKIDDNIHRFSDTNKNGKTFMNVDAGWCANVDERDSQSYYKIFDIDPSANHPDQNSNFQIYSAGNNEYIEIEVLSPLQNLSKGETMRYDQIWSAAKVKGIHYGANAAGSIIEQLSFNTENDALNGQFGIFTSGSLVVKAFNSTTNNSTELDAGNVEAGQLFNLSTTLSEIDGIDSVAVIALNNNKEEIGTLAHWSNIKVGIQNLKQNTVQVIPTVLVPGQMANVRFNNDIKSVKASLVSLGGKITQLGEYSLNNSFGTQISVPVVVPGIYILNIETPEQVFHEKIIIK